MSAVPLMKLHNSSRGTGDTRDSDQMSDEEDDPLESVLARMKYRPQNYRSQDFYSSMMFTGAVCFIIGFVASYITFISMDRNKKPCLNNDPHVATAILNTIVPSNVESYLSDLNKHSEGNISQNEYQANLLFKHFKDLKFDTVSLQSSMVQLSYFDKLRPNRVSIVDKVKNTVVDSFNSSESVYFSAPNGVPISNTVEGPVVYINFGRDSDFRYLKKMGIDVKECIVLARLGRVSPVELVDRALTKGASGVVLYADPQQYPNTESLSGPLLWPSQLGLLQFLHENPPTHKTHGIVNGGNRGNAGCVPVQIISSIGAQQILLQMSSSNQSHKSWMGSLKTTTYPMGPEFSNLDYRLKLEINAVHVEKNFFNVIAAIRGSGEPDRYVLLGSDREPLAVYNSDPLEGTANMMELARALSNLRSNRKWCPHRTIVFCSWGVTQTEGHFRDAPLTGDWADLLDSRAVAYLNIDTSRPGNNNFVVHSTPLLSKLLNDATSLVPFPSASARKTTLREMWLHETPNVSNSQYPIVNAVTTEEDLQTLLHNQGIPSIHFQFSQIQDPNGVIQQENRLHYLKAAVQLWGILTWSLADSLVLPFDVQQYASFLNESVSILENKYDAVVTSCALPLALLQDAINNFSKTAETFQKKLVEVEKAKTLQVRILNDQLLQLERAFLHHSPNRTRHIVLSPGSSISDNPAIGFGTLQDQLSDANTSPIPEDLCASTSAHITSLVHCINSANIVLEEPLVPLTFNNFGTLN